MKGSRRDDTAQLTVSKPWTRIEFEIHWANRARVAAAYGWDWLDKPVLR
jgi:hypothetical protein